MGIIDELRSKNFSIYAQVCGLASIVLLGVLGALSFGSNVIFCIIGWVIAFVLVFVEIPLCIRICPTSQKFDVFVRTFENHWVRTGGYIGFSVVMWISLSVSTTLLIVPAITLLLTGVFYGIAAALRQEHKSIAVTGGTGIARGMV